MICAKCGEDLAIVTVIRMDPDESTVASCAGCGARRAAVSCEVGHSPPCGRIPSLRCVGCHRYVCDRHEESRKGRMCQTCASRLSQVVRSPGRGRRYGGR